MTRFARPVSDSSRAAYWPVRPMTRRTLPASATTSCPATVALPRSGRSSVVRTRTVVVLPAPFGPSRPRISPAATCRSSPSRACVLPKALRRPRASMAGALVTFSLPHSVFRLVRRTSVPRTVYFTVRCTRVKRRETAMEREPGGGRPRQPRWHGWQGNPDDLWRPMDAGAPRPGRQPAGRDRDRARPRLSREEIVDAAIAIADAEGADAISMRRIAQVLQAGTMSLYWHVANKEHLLDLMLDALIAEVEVPEPSGDWRADLRALGTNYRAMLLRHLWMMDFVGGRPPLGPNTMLNMDCSLALLDVAEPDIATAVNILSTLLTYVLGAVLREAREIRVEREQERAEFDPAEWEPARAAWRDRLDADGRFTRVVRFLDAGLDPDAAETRDERFE